MKKRSDWKLVRDLNKKGDVWVSAVLYFGLGIVVLTLILSVGMPVVNRLRDKNIATQTKDVFSSLDSYIREVARGGPSTQRILQLQMQKGELKVYDTKNEEKVGEMKVKDDVKKILSFPKPNVIKPQTLADYITSIPNRIVWTYDGKAALSEPGLLVTEGNTKILTLGGSGAYTVRYWLDYEPQIYLRMVGVNTLSGGTKINIKNLGGQCKCEYTESGVNKFEPKADGTCPAINLIDNTCTQDATPRVAIEIRTA